MFGCVGNVLNELKVLACCAHCIFDVVQIGVHYLSVSAVAILHSDMVG